jgi:hypothetical protein
MLPADLFTIAQQRNQELNGWPRWARVRPIDGMGLELRYMWKGELRVIQICRS